jgi:hypothetical protein
MVRGWARGRGLPGRGARSKAQRRERAQRQQRGDDTRRSVAQLRVGGAAAPASRGHPLPPCPAPAAAPLMPRSRPGPSSARAASMSSTPAGGAAQWGSGSARCDSRPGSRSRSVVGRSTSAHTPATEAAKMTSAPTAVGVTGPAAAAAAPPPASSGTRIPSAPPRVPRAPRSAHTAAGSPRAAPASGAGAPLGSTYARAAAARAPARLGGEGPHRSTAGFSSVQAPVRAAPRVFGVLGPNEPTPPPPGPLTGPPPALLPRRRAPRRRAHSGAAPLLAHPHIGPVPTAPPAAGADTPPPPDQAAATHLAPRRAPQPGCSRSCAPGPRPCPTR